MNATCAFCRQAFATTEDDLKIYTKASPVIREKTYTIPPPTLCPDCRVQRRMAWRNDRTFYHRKCDLSGKQIISIYPEKTVFPVYHQSEWYSDKWDPITYGQAFDFSRNFFEQWNELMQSVPRLGMDLVNCENSDYCNYCGDDKNCYLDIAGEANEDCYFDLFTKYSRNCVDCTFAYSSTLCYECIQCYNCYNVRYSMSMDDCSYCAFCVDCKGCRNCLLSINLRNKEYCILNEQLTKEEYEQRVQELNLSSHASVEHLKSTWQKERIAKGIYRDSNAINCEQCSGDNLKNCKNCLHCFNASGSENCKYLYDVLDATDCHDLNYSLYKPEAAYELISTLNIVCSAFNMASHYCSNVYYCDLTNNSKNLFGCIGLNRKEYCILNKQYLKEEYEEFLPRIIEHMKQTGEWGQFFPVNLSPFGYNETVAQEYMPISQQEAEERGWNWCEEKYPGKQYLGPPVLIPHHINDVTDDICNQILLCEITGKPYKIIPQELVFYRQTKTPLPHRCPEERHQERNMLRNPRKLWQRNCDNCRKEIETTYASDRPEKVFCEECYLASIY